MSKNDSAATVGQQLSSFESPAVADDWENISNDQQLQQLTNERLNLAEQQKQTSVVEQQFMNEQQSATDEIGLPASMINKPIKILRREQPIRNRANESEGKDEAALLDKLTLDERKANYDKIRERIFNAANSEDASKSADKKKSPKKANAAEPEASTSSEVVVETINHLSNVQMLSEQTPHRIRPVAPLAPPQPRQQPIGLYGMPPQPMRFVPPPDFSRPPPMGPNPNLYNWAFPPFPPGRHS